MLFLAVLQLLSMTPGGNTGVDVGTIADDVGAQRFSDVTLIYAQITPICSVEAEGDDAQVDLSNRSEQIVGQVNYRCNSPNGFTRRISSENGGLLRRGAQGIPYFVSESGDGALAFDRVQLSAPVVDQIAASPLVTMGSSGFFKVDVPNLPRGLIAGEYRDVVSIEITPN